MSPSASQSPALPLALSERLRLFRALSAELRRAIARFGASSPLEVAAQAAELESLCGSLARGPNAAAPRPEDVAELTAIMNELGMVTAEVRQLNQIYAFLVRESRRTAAALLHHLGAQSGAYALGPGGMMGNVQGAELRVSS